MTATPTPVLTEVTVSVYAEVGDADPVAATTITASAAGRVEVDGTQAFMTSDADLVVGFLESVNPLAVQHEALNTLDVSQPLAAAIIAVLAAHARTIAG